MDDPGAMLDARLDALRQAGAPRLDPARWHYVESLSQRLPQQPQAVQARLQQTLAAELQRWDERLRACAAATSNAPPSAPGPCTPLAQLHALLARREDAALAAEAPAPIRVRGELASARRFRQAWSAERASAQVEQAAARLPANAGPLNSQALVLQTLALMQELSPAYLARFLVQVESLQWLERVAAAQPPAAARASKGAKPARRAAAQPAVGVSESRKRK